MAEHNGFAEFTSYIKRILIGAAVVLGCYLAIPIFVAKRCAKTEVTRSTTRPPFPDLPIKNEKLNSTKKRNSGTLSKRGKMITIFVGLF